MWQWSTDDVAAFWKSIWTYFQVEHTGQYEEVLTADAMHAVRWFEGARLNYAEHIFRSRSVDSPALIHGSESGDFRHISWFELEQQVQALKFYLHSQGLQMGDRVVAYLPNTPEAIIAFLAVNSAGAVWSCCSPDFGAQTVLDRFTQIQPKFFIGVDGYVYNGKTHDRSSECRAIAAALPTVEKKVMFRNIDMDRSLPEDWVCLHSIYSSHRMSAPLTFERVPFAHPIWILFSSGTTGKPKAITHSHGGVLLEHLKYLNLHNDVKPGEHFFWYTTTGWMMWNFLQASMLVGAVPVLYDGSPSYPDMHVLWKMAEQVDVAHFGTSAPFLVACMKDDVGPGARYDLTGLRSIGSTGSPLAEDVFDWVYEEVGKDIWLCSMSGGTDVCTAFVGGNPYLPVRRGRIQSRALGCAMFAYDENGQRQSTGLGEMVIEKPMPSMPIYFWNDHQYERLLNTYYRHFPGNWRHGDYIQIFDDGSLVIKGRSDATLNRKGVRMGTSEIYNALRGIDHIKDALIINLERPQGGDFMPLFIVLGKDVELDRYLRDEIKNTLRTICSPRHVPDHISVVPDLPYTLSGKKMEIPVKKLLLGLSLQGNKAQDAVRNPKALEYFREIAATFSQTYLKG